MASPDGLVRWYLSAIDEMAVAGMVGISSIQGYDWCEVDDLVDFAHAEEAVANWHDRTIKPASHSLDRKRHIQQKAA
jgi:hypothetical protein